MSWAEEVGELDRRRHLAERMGGPEGIAKHKERGKLTARERIAALADAGSFAETMALVGTGVVEGRARVLLSASEMSDLLPGEILVVHTTDVGWTPLFCVAAGVVTELGGPLSHAAVVARELAVPSVVNVDGVTRALKTGDRIRLDGDAGVVEKLSGR